MHAQYFIKKLCTHNKNLTFNPLDYLILLWIKVMSMPMIAPQTEVIPISIMAWLTLKFEEEDINKLQDRLVKRPRTKPILNPSMSNSSFLKQFKTKETSTAKVKHPKKMMPKFSFSDGGKNEANKIP